MRVKLSTNDFRVSVSRRRLIRRQLYVGLCQKIARDSVILGSSGQALAIENPEAGLVGRRKAIDAQAPLTMIASDEFPRENYLLKR